MSKKSKKSKTLPLVLIQWHDHTSNDAWLDKADAQKETLVVVHSIGWLIRSDKEKYVIAAGWSEDAGLTNVQTIGKGLVINIKKIKYVTARPLKLDPSPPRS